MTIGRLRLSGSFLPYHWLQGLPGMAQVLPDRFCILGAGAAGAVLAFSLDRARSAAWQRDTWRRGIPAAIAVLAVLPLIPLPYQAGRVPPVPAGWQAAFGRLRLAPDAPVLVVPVPWPGTPRPCGGRRAPGSLARWTPATSSGPTRRATQSSASARPQDVADYLNLSLGRQGTVPRPPPPCSVPR